MREIKFRAWDKRTKELIQIQGFKYVGEKHIQLFYFDADGCSTTCTCEKEFIVLMQYTGLKDKNGTEIYEGGIIKCDYFTGVVEYRENAGIYVIGNKELEKCITFFDIHMGRGKVEVIGNIHENPELLEGRK